MCSLRDAADPFADLLVEVYAISLDDVTDLAKFAEKQTLNFGLLSDPDGSAARKYGVLMEKRNFARRVTFVIDGKGVLRLVDEKVDVSTHGADLARAINGIRD